MANLGRAGYVINKMRKFAGARTLCALLLISIIELSQTGTINFAAAQGTAARSAAPTHWVGAQPDAAPPCQFQKADQPLNVAFCDTFDQPKGTGNRSGDLNGLVWGVSRIIGASGGDNFPVGTNPSQGFVDNWPPVGMQACGVGQTVFPDNDIVVCNGQLFEAVNDDGGQIDQAMYPKQPFDIAGRTGTATFDVSADSQGPHAAWPVFVYTDQPLPAPSSKASGIATFARNSIGFTVAAACGQWGCGPDNHYPNLGKPSFDGTCTSIDQIFITTNYELTELDYKQLACVLKPTQAGQTNHFEVRLSPTKIQIWATDAGATSLKEIAEASNIAVPLTRGLIWIEDVHYNGDKFNTQQSHTFVWDNVGFDGPSLPRDLAFDVAENKTMDNDPRWPAGPAMQLGWETSSSGSPLTLVVPNVNHVAEAAGAVLTLNWFPTKEDTISYQVNNQGWHVQPWVFESTTYSWKTVALPVPLSELHDGNNTVALKTSDGAAVANVDVILVAAGGPPCSNNPSRGCPTPRAWLPLLFQ